MAENDTEEALSEPAPEPVPRARRAGRWLRRRAPLLAAAMAGVLAGAGGVAWQTGVIFPGEERECWGALSQNDVARLVGDNAWTDVQEQGVTDYPTHVAPEGSCLIRDHNDALEVRLHGRGTAPGPDTGPFAFNPAAWEQRFLNSEMAWLGGGLTGMASPGEAWVALPTECYGSDLDGPAIVEIIDTFDRPVEGYDTPQEAVRARELMARTVVQLANAALAELGCPGAPLPEPRTASLPALQEVSELSGSQRENLCGIPGLTAPASLIEDVWGQRLPEFSGDDPVRVCELYGGSSEFQLRLTTVDHPGLVTLLGGEPNWGGYYDRRENNERFSTDTGSGTIGRHRSSYFARCHEETGLYDEDVAFLVQYHGGNDSETDNTALLRDYVAAEAQRLGCQPLDPPSPD
ncbi:hypothetical protein RM780_25365 [Streptomyces sp. DSM 44917]|uniref:Uncharacterized protein n=1 Tax=Streptomyces boetiae TaxID=3075541 RepID=A0ABU2LFI0_9ACTN|nr:hypothetical protein [Streptomyces sp. DSM 44917]MDT0310256.1 hypothetical protein [Streptomyces sp. DSM 44917]